MLLAVNNDYQCAVMLGVTEYLGRQQKAIFWKEFPGPVGAVTQGSHDQQLQRPAGFYPRPSCPALRRSRHGTLWQHTNI